MTKTGEKEINTFKITIIFSSDNFNRNYYASGHGMVYTINNSFKLDTKHLLLFDFPESASVSYTVKIHDSHFYLPTYLSTSIPGIYHQLKQGETYMGRLISL